MAYARARLGGLEEIDEPPRISPGRRATRRIRRRLRGDGGDARGALGGTSPKRTVRPKAQVCAGPIKYVGHDEVRAESTNLKAALEGAKAEEAFVTAISPSNLELITRTGTTPRTRNISPRSPTRCTRNTRRSSMPVSSCRSTTRGWPRITTARRTHRSRNAASSSRAGRGGEPRAARHSEDRVRFHTCYSVNIAPRVHDFELRHFVDLMLKIKRGPIRSKAPIRAMSTNGRSGRR